MAKRSSVTCVKPSDPPFLKKLKERVGYKESPSVDTKREHRPVEDADPDLDDEKPVVVVLKAGDLTAEEAEMLSQRQASVVTHYVEETIMECYTSSSTTPGTHPAPQVDALTVSTGPASPAPVLLAATTSDGASEGIMEHEDNEALDWDTVHYRRYTM
ncbi:hypothetical protein HPB50_011282 [Hyalomma asiaticum]|uniref:Uncharacterized protein n=1 Tax=Hyalomma asiaticum TaxID=266040 RepID=A0ACB7TJ40_HYAAI|nr:hypothetical protein HPB50_011282 [Hyalomma asiaticum]